MQPASNPTALQEQLVDYLKRIVPRQVSCGSDFPHRMQNWAVDVSAAGGSGTARNDVVQMWSQARGVIDSIDATSEGRFSRSTFDEPVRSVFLWWMEHRAHKPQDAFDGGGDGDPSASRNGFDGNLSDDERELVRQVCENYPKRTRFADRLDPDLIRDTALSKVEQKWKPDPEDDEATRRAKLKGFARTVVRNTLFNFLRRFGAIEEYDRPGGPVDNPARDPGSDAIDQLIGAGDWRDSAAYLTLWVNTTPLAYHKILSLFWQQSGIARNWPYSEEQFAVLLGWCTAMVCTDLSPLLRAALERRMMGRPLPESLATRNRGQRTRSPHAFGMTLSTVPQAAVHLPLRSR